MKSFQEIQGCLRSLPPNIKRIYLLGTTGAGKTSIVRNIIGTSALGFPITTQTRTTLATTEYVIKRDLPFKTTIILKQKEDVLEAIEELIQDAIQKAIENKRLTDIDYITERLQESSDERFRLRYMVDNDALKNHAVYIVEHIIPLVAKKGLDDETLFADTAVETEISFLRDSILKGIEQLFNEVCGDQYTLFSDKLYCIENIIDKSAFIKKNKELLKNEYGSISLLIDYIRIEGNLLADWLDNSLELVLIDGEGIAHSLQEKRDTLSTRHYDYFDFCDQILLVEKGDDPFISGGQAAIEAILLNGYNNKFKLIFSKIDKIEQADKNSFLRKRLENLKAALKQKRITLELDNKDCYKLESLNLNSTTDASQRQIKRLLKDIKESEDSEPTPLEYDFLTLLLNLDTTLFIKNFQKDLDSEHWAVVKAFSKRMYDHKEEYKHLKPIAFIHTFIMNEIDVFLKRDDQAKAEIYNAKSLIQQRFSKELLAYIREEFQDKKNYLWQQAFEKKGIGSSKERKLFIIENILKDCLPEKESEQRFDGFKKNIKALLLKSGAEILASAKKIVIKKVDIKGIHGHKSFSWELAEDINVLLGKNGSGKSTILKLIYACITHDKAIFNYFENPYVTLTLEKMYENDNTKEITVSNNSAAANVDVQLINTFDVPVSKNIEGTELDTILSKLIVDFGEYIRVLKSHLDNETRVDSLAIDDILKNIANAEQEEFNQLKNLKTKVDIIKKEKFKRVNYFEKAINGFYKETHKFIETDKDKPLIVKMIANETTTTIIDIFKLSSGEKQLLIIFLTVILQGDKSFILLMDEPESSLHVEWQAMLLDSLKGLNDNVQIIIATHNPLLALNRKFNEIGRVEVDSDAVQIDSGGTKYLDVSATLLNYFDLSSLVGTEMKGKLRDLFTLKTQEELSGQDKDKLDALEKELGNTLATNFIYDRHYLSFLRFIKENHQIDFDKLTVISTQEMNELLGEFKGLFDD